MENDFNKNILLTEKQTSDFLKFSTRTLQVWRCRGEGPQFVKISKRGVRYRFCDLEAWIKEHLQTQKECDS